MKKIIFLNGKFIPQEEAKISVFEPGFLYGWGLFETMRSYRNHIVYFDAHLKRMQKSCRLIHIQFPYSIAKLKKTIKELITANGLLDAYVRLTLLKKESGADALIIARKYQPYSEQKYRQGFRACICSFRQNENSSIAQLKTINYLLYRLAYAQAKTKGFDEAIILNNRGYICEGSRANMFFIKDNTVFTPLLECGCLDGITRRVIFELAKKYKIKIYEGNFSLSQVYSADEAFLTNSLIAVMPLAAIEKQLIRQGRAGKITKFFIKKYNYLLENGI